MTGLMLGSVPDFHIVEIRERRDLLCLDKDSLFGTVSGGRGWGCRGKTMT